MASTDPNFGLTYGWALGESGWHTSMDANLKRLGAVVGLSVKDRDLTTPPASPVDGDRYIIPAAATGVWAGTAHELRRWVYGGGKVLPGLVTRREAEVALLTTDMKNNV